MIRTHTVTEGSVVKPSRGNRFIDPAFENGKIVSDRLFHRLEVRGGKDIEIKKYEIQQRKPDKGD